MSLSWGNMRFGHQAAGCKPVAERGSPLKRIDTLVTSVRFSAHPVADVEFFCRQRMEMDRLGRIWLVLKAGFLRYHC